MPNARRYRILGALLVVGERCEEAAPAIQHTTHVHGIFKAGIIVDEFEKVLATLRERQVPIAIGPFPARDGQRANVIVRDNSGNLIQFFGK